MKNESSAKVLLLNLLPFFESGKAKQKYTPPPLGLMCLQEAFQGEVLFADCPTGSLEYLKAECSQMPVTAILCMLPPSVKTSSSEDISSDFERLCSEYPCYDLLSELRKIFPDALIGCNSLSQEYDPCFDFAVLGTGRSCINRILAGDLPKGFYDDVLEDESFPLPIATTPLVKGLYSVMPEISLSSLYTIEIASPWAGINDYANPDFALPSKEFIGKLIDCLCSSDYKSIHFSNAYLSPEIFQDCKLNDNAILVSMTAGNKLYDNYKSSGIHRLWFQNASEAVLLLNSFDKKLLPELGLQETFAKTAMEDIKSLLPILCRLAVIKAPDTNRRLLQRSIVRFLFIENGFWKGLFAIRNMSDLIIFMRRINWFLEAGVL